MLRLCLLRNSRSIVHENKFWNKEGSNAHALSPSLSTVRRRCELELLREVEAPHCCVYSSIVTTPHNRLDWILEARASESKKESEEEHKQVEKYKYCFSIASHLSAIAFTRPTTTDRLVRNASSKEYHNEK